jgi:hypothetical protein
MLRSARCPLGGDTRTKEGHRRPPEADGNVQDTGIAADDYGSPFQNRRCFRKTGPPGEIEHML